MSDNREKTTLFYGGQEFDLNGDNADILDEYKGEPGAISMNLGGGKWLTIAVGAGIPVAVMRQPKPKARIRVIN